MQAADDFAHERVLDHVRHPRNSGLLQPADARAKSSNPLCGDWVEVSLRFDAAGRVEAVGFVGVGCSVSQASASILFGAIAGKARADLQSIREDEVISMLGLELNNNRKKCAYVALQALQEAAAPGRHARP